MQAFLERSAGGLSWFAPELRGLRVRFGEGQAARLVIHAAAGERVLPATDGEVRLPIDRRLAEENPRVSVSKPAVGIDAWLD